MARISANPVETASAVITNRYFIHFLACMSFGLVLYMIDYEIFLREPN